MLNAINKTLFLKKPITWDDFNYPPRLAWVALLVMSLIVGFTNPYLNFFLDMGWGYAFFILLTVVMFYSLITLFMRWLMKRKGCDDQGRMFRLVIVTSTINLLTNILGAFLLPDLRFWFQLLSWLGWFWITAHTLNQVCSRASIGYSVATTLLSIIPALLLTILLIRQVFFLLFHY